MEHVVSKGWFRIEVYDRPSLLIRAVASFMPSMRTRRGRKIAEHVFPNGMTTGGANDMLGTYFNSGTQQTAWSVGLIDNVSFSALNAADTMSSHAGWIENTAFSGNRPTWTPAAASGGAISGTGPVSITVNSSVAIKGAFVCSNNTRGGTSGILWATGLLGSVQNLTNGQILSISYSTTLTANN
jgi:hypothetical protein